MDQIFNKHAIKPATLGRLLNIRRKHIFLIVVPYAENQAHGQHVSHQRASPVTDERKRDTRDWQQAHRHANILKNVEGQHTDNPDTNICIEVISRFHPCFRNMVNQKEKQRNDNT